MSHSEDCVAIAVTRGRQIGIDGEFIRPIEDMHMIAEHNFSAQERALLDSPQMFFTCWARKEAYIKAVGKGLSLPLNSFDTSMARGSTGRTLPSTADSPQVDRWWLMDLSNLRSTYAGALVVESGCDSVLYSFK